MELSGKKILVTGADGFIGSHLVEKLVDLNYQVKAFVYYNSFNSWGWLDSFPKEKLNKIEVFAGDIRDAGCVRNAVKDVDVIFHLAALIAIPYSYYAPSSYVETNITGTLNILQAAKDFKTQKVLVTSTSEVYGTAIYTPIDEKHPRQGQSPYSATKIGADHIAESFYRSFDLPVTIVRPFNTYGPRQSARAVIPTIITQLLNGIKEIKLGSLHPQRDLVFVKDTVNGFIEIAKSDKLTGEEVNIATNETISVGDLASKIITLISPDAKIITAGERIRPEKSEVDLLLGSNSKIKSLTGWKQSWTLDKGIKETIEWFKNPENLKRYKSDIFNL
jgi:NAD dependent epimerase/dehydratase